MSRDERAANRWTLWGFHRQTQTDNTNQAPQTLTQQQQETTTINGNTQHDHQQQAQMHTMENHSETTADHWQQPHNQTTATNNTTIWLNAHDSMNTNREIQELPLLPIPAPQTMDAISNPYINPWGDCLEQPKPSDMVQICLQNFGSWPKSRKHQKNDNIRRFVNSAEIDIFLTTENNLAWHKLPSNDRLHKRTHGWWESLHISTAHTKPIKTQACTNQEG